MCEFYQGFKTFFFVNFNKVPKISLISNKYDKKEKMFYDSLHVAMLIPNTAEDALNAFENRHCAEISENYCSQCAEIAIKRLVFIRNKLPN